MLLMLIAVGGAAGALARHALTALFQGPAGAAFPWGTFVVNATGCFAIGLMMRWLETSAARPEIRALVAVGFLGAFTTFSTFSWETVRLVQDGAWLRAAAYAGGSLLVGTVAVVAGITLAGLLRGATPA